MMSLTGKAVKQLQKALKKDALLYEAYRSSIAMAYIDTVAKNKDKKVSLHQIANEAADRFLKQFIEA